MSDLGAILETGAAAAIEVAASALAERGEKVHPCPNCGKPMIGPYCAVCGQERDTHRRSIWGLAKVLVEDIVSFDSRILRTGWALVLKPGELASAFREGRTQRYLPALRLYLFVSLIFFLILGVTNIAIMQFLVVGTPVKVVWVNGTPYIPNPAYDKDDPDTHFMPKMMKISKEKATQPGGPFDYSTKVYFFQRIGAYHSALSKQARERLAHPHVEFGISDEKGGKTHKLNDQTKSWFEQRIFDGLQRIAADPAALNGALTTWIPRVLFFLLPLYAIWLAIFYWRQRKQFYFVDHLIFSLTIHTFGFVLLMAAAGAAQILPGDFVSVGTALIGGVYGLIATRNFYRQNWFWTVVKYVFVSFFYVCFCVLPALGVVIALSFLNV